MDIYARIRQVAFELIAEGEWPTVVEVRARLGTGSNTTINNTLKQWRQEFLARMASNVRRPDWPTGLAEAVDQLWQRACDQAESHLESLREECKAEVERLVGELAEQHRQYDARSAQLAALAQEHELLKQQYQQLQQQYAEEARRRQVLEESLSGLTSSLDEARQQLLLAQKDADNRVVALEQRHDERLQQAAQEAARRETLAYERFEGMRIQLYQQVESERSSFKQQAAQWQAQLQQLERERDEVRQTLREQQADAAREQGRQQAQYEMAQQRLQAMAEELQVGRKQGEELQTRLLALTSELASRTTQLQERDRQLPLLQRWLQQERELLQAMTPEDYADILQQRFAILLEQTA
ncbi:DNA-binding protein [Vogesella oryzae]|uniref:DNA-binding protein n=1 Tax=Vogesella oryzae TaxID=1735285 RepID=UPI001583B28D|nr:DNA-binding protein [Vogesella oryzae]